MRRARYYSKPGFDLGAVWKDRNLAPHQSNPGQITELGADLSMAASTLQIRKKKP
jgi:hypothetical protein